MHLPSDHALASRPHLTLPDLAEETILIGATGDSSGFTDRVLSAFSQHGIAPRTLTDPYPDLGLQAVREHLGVVVYARSAFPAQLDGSVFIPLRPPLGLPFHLATQQGADSAPIRSILKIAGTLASKPVPDP